MVKSMNSKRLHRHALPSGVMAMDLIGDSGLAIAGCMDGVYQLNLESGEHSKLYQHDSYVSGVTFCPVQQSILSCGYDGNLKWFDWAKRSQLDAKRAFDFWCWDLASTSQYLDQQENPRQLAAVSGGQYLAGDYDYRPQESDASTVKVFDAAERKLIAEFRMLPPVQAVALSGDGAYVAAANLMGDIKVWDVQQQKQVASWNTPDFTAFGIIKSHCQIGGIYSLLFSPHNEILVCGMGPMRDPMAGNGKQRWQKFNWQETPVMVSQSRDEQTGEGLMETLCLSPDGKQFVMAGRLRGGAWSTGLFDLESGELIHSIKSDSRVTKARFSSDGQILYLAGAINQSGDANHKFGVVDVFEMQNANAESTAVKETS